MKPVFFNTEMTRAIQSGRKSITRRLIKPQPKYCMMSWAGLVVSEHPIEIIDGLIAAKCADVRKEPYLPGDILYVRETWSVAPALLGAAPGPVYKADYTEKELAELKARHFRWHPSIHMPVSYTRIFLRVTKVRAEHLQDITEEDAIREGTYQIPDQSIDAGRYTFTAEPQPGHCWTTARDCFRWGIWNSTVQKADRPFYGWDANPWVRVIEFEQITRETAFKEDRHEAFRAT